jgi:enoyl-CoA hydratase
METRRYTRSEISGYVATVWLHDPPLNLIREEMKEELLAILDGLEKDGRVCVVVVTGTGDKAFCAGRNLHQTQSWQRSANPQLEAVWERGDRLIDRLLFFPKLTVAALNGVALGGGCELTLPFDLVLAERRSQIGLPESTRGLWPGTGAVKLLPKKVGFFRAKEMVFLGKVLTADEAVSWGLISAVVDKPALEAALEFAGGLTRVSFHAMMRAKEVMNRHERWPDSESMNYERTQFSRLFSTPDAREGVDSFFEKRQPHFEW